jgi:hypothetical protein
MAGRRVAGFILAPRGEVVNLSFHRSEARSGRASVRPLSSCSDDAARRPELQSPLYVDGVETSPCLPPVSRTPSLLLIMSPIRLRIDGRTFRDPQNREVILVRTRLRNATLAHVLMLMVA